MPESPAVRKQRQVQVAPKPELEPEPEPRLQLEEYEEQPQPERAPAPEPEPEPEPRQVEEPAWAKAVEAEAAEAAPKTIAHVNREIRWQLEITEASAPTPAATLRLARQHLGLPAGAPPLRQGLREIAEHLGIETGWEPEPAEYDLDFGLQPEPGQDFGAGQRSPGKQPAIFDKLTDHKQFIGAHKARFTADGRGRGKAGRVQLHEGVLTDGLASMVRNQDAPASALHYDDDDAEPVAKVPSKRQPAIFDKLTDHTQFTGAHKARFGADGRGLGKEGRLDLQEDALTNGIATMMRNPNAPVNTRRPEVYSDDESIGAEDSASGTTDRPDDIYAKLTDVRQFTGHHKHRFDQQSGKGLGKAGRDTVRKGVGTKTELNPDFTLSVLSPTTAGEKNDMYVDHLREIKHQEKLAEIKARAELKQKREMDKRWREEEQSVEAREKRRILEERETAKHERREAARLRKEAEVKATQELQQRYAMNDSSQQGFAGGGRGGLLEGVPASPRQTPWTADHYAKAGRVQHCRASTNGTSSVTSSRVSRSSQGSNIFDKLTDHNQFTGAHKARFDAKGRGQGKAGRTELTETWSDPKVSVGAIVRNAAAPTVPTGGKAKSRAQSAMLPGGAMKPKVAKKKTTRKVSSPPPVLRQVARVAVSPPRHPYRNSSPDDDSPYANAVETALIGAKAAAEAEDKTSELPTALPAAVEASLVGVATEEGSGSSDEDDADCPVNFLKQRRAQSVERERLAKAPTERRVAAQGLRAKAEHINREGDAEAAARKMAEGIAQLEAALAAVQGVSSPIDTGPYRTRG